MIDKIKQLIESDGRYKEIIKKVHLNPYIEQKELLANFPENDTSFYELATDKLISKFIFVELTSQAGSTVESRVPKKILIVNPEVSGDLDSILKD